MKKLLLLLVSAVFLAACSSTSNSESPALQNITFYGLDNKFDVIELHDEQLIMTTDEASNEVTPDTDPEEVTEERKTVETYEITNVTSDNDVYTIETKEKFTLTLTKVGERIVEDETGKKYTTTTQLP